LATLVPAGAEYFFVPRDESDGDPAKFGLEIQGDVRARDPGRRFARLAQIVRETGAATVGEAAQLSA
jgi:hypothetical protein